MIKASFKRRGGALYGFRVCGHSGYADEGADIVCAAVSAMTMYTVNLLGETFGLLIELGVDDSGADIELSLKQESDIGDKIIGAFKAELEALSQEYPQNILVKE